MLRRHISKFIVPLSLALTLAVPSFGQSHEPTKLGPNALKQIALIAAEKRSRTPAEKKITSDLLYEYRRSVGDSRMVGLEHLQIRSGLRSNGTVLIDLDAEVSVALLGAIEQLGGEIVSAHERFNAARVHLPLASVVELARIEAVRSMRPADQYMIQSVPAQGLSSRSDDLLRKSGTVVTEGDVAHGTDVIRATRGVDGTGVGVGAMSDSVDALTDLQNSGELPPGVTVLPGQSGNPASSEGTALLEIVHDMAPGADLFFATGQGGQAQMAQNILDLQAAGCDVIVDDILYFTEPVFQDGVIAQAVDTVTAAGTVYFSSSGNSGNLNAGTSGVHEGDYTATTVPPLLAGTYVSVHDFDGLGADATELTADTPFFITLQWANPQGGATDDYDLILLDAALENVITASATVQDGTQNPVEVIDSTARDDTGNKIVVAKFSGNDVFIHLNTHRGRIEHGTDGQIYGHPAAEGAIAIGAVDVAEAGGGQFTGGPGIDVEFFSSDGPRRIFFEADGSPVAAALGTAPLKGTEKGGQTSVVRQKPDLAAADGVSTTTPGFNPFFGSSASAPHSAAISALYKELFPSVGSDSIADLFKSSALDIGDPGIDRDSGSGIMMLEPAVDNTIFADGFESGDASSWTESVP